MEVTGQPETHHFQDLHEAPVGTPSYSRLPLPLRQQSPSLRGSRTVPKGGVVNTSRARAAPSDPPSHVYAAGAHVTGQGVRE